MKYLEDFLKIIRRFFVIFTIKIADTPMFYFYHSDIWDSCVCPLSKITCIKVQCFANNLCTESTSFKNRPLFSIDHQLIVEFQRNNILHKIKVFHKNEQISALSCQPSWGETVPLEE